MNLQIQTPLLSMATSKFHSTDPPFSAHFSQETIRTRYIFSRKRNRVNKVSAKLSEPNVKKANLCARRKERIKIPSYSNNNNNNNNNNSIFHISQFLSHPSGIEAILNSKALLSYHSLDSKLYRCMLPQVKLLNFEVAPIIDLKLNMTAEDCSVEMVSCKVEGSDVVERQNEHFSASMQNNIKWETVASETFLDVDVRLNLVLEIYTQPFTMLPPSTIEGPGNIIMQALVDKMVPLLLQQLVQDYEDWISNQISLCEV